MALADSKRKTLKTLLGGSVAGAALLSSDRWLKPVIDTVTIPVHASTTGVTESATVQ